MKQTRKKAKKAAPTKAHISLKVNGEPVEVAFAPHKTLLEVLREDLGLTGTKHGCELGECGTCTVLADGEPVLSCLALPADYEGAALTTVEGMAQAFVIDPATSDFAYSSVIALRPGVYDASYFRSWRDSFDEGACSQSGGVVGNAETTIAGRTVYIGRCDGGVSTYHVRLDERDAIVSISAFGEHRLGELLLADLRP